ALLAGRSSSWLAGFARIRPAASDSQDVVSPSRSRSTGPSSSWRTAVAAFLGLTFVAGAGLAGWSVIAWILAGVLLGGIGVLSLLGGKYVSAPEQVWIPEPTPPPLVEAVPEPTPPPEPLAEIPTIDPRIDSELASGVTRIGELYGAINGLAGQVS